jgi:serine/threonine protein phosphatase PrpC
MGNLLGSPITEKDTHIGCTYDEQSIDDGGLQYGISSMQGWRVHMEDAHICQPFLYAETAEIESNLSAADNDDMAGSNNNTSSTINNNSNSSKKYYKQIPLQNHSLFAIFDGHGGSFAAEYASRNLLRVLSRQDKFVEYTKKWNGRDDYLESVRRNVVGECEVDGEVSGEGVEVALDNNEKTTTPTDSDDADKQRLQALIQRGKESDENVKKIKERVRRHFDGDDNEEDNEVDGVKGNKKKGWWTSSSTSTTTNTNHDGTPQRKQSQPTTNNNTSTHNNNNTQLNLPTTPQNSSNAIQIAQASYDHTLMTLLEGSLVDALLDLDKEIYEEVSLCICGSDGVEGVGVSGGGVSKRSGREDRNSVYGIGYPFDGSSGGDRITGGGDRTRSDGGVGHLPKETTMSSSLSSFTTEDHNQQQNSNQEQQQQQPQPPPPPTPSDDEDSGTTVTIVLLTPRWIVCANAGDSRAVYSRSNHRVVPLSYDHKPDDEEEERRINDAGGYVSAGRVEGDLAVSRGLGDFRFKEEEAVLSGARGESSGVNSRTNSSSMLKPSDQKVSPIPDIIVQNRDRSEDEFIIIACDGIWDVQTNQECVNMVADIFNEGEDNLGLVCEEILDLCLIKGSKDNMTAAVIKFPKQVVGKGGGGGVMARRERRGVSEEEDGLGTAAAGVVATAASR